MYFKSGLEDEKFIDCKEISKRKCLLITQLSWDFTIAHEMANHLGMQHKLANCIKELIVCLGICSTSTQEQVQKEVENLVK